MAEALATVVVLALVVYVWMVQPLQRFRRGTGRKTRLPDPWVT
jgi:hypothetical protein